jgi:hypothetical protein
MLPGPTMIRKCSICTGLILEDTIASGNTFGARYWTDGKMEAPMLPDEPWLVKCPHCGALVWLDKQQLVGQTGPWGEGDEKLNEALPFTIPSLEDYFVVLAKKVRSKKKLRYLRLRAWWAGNDTRRNEENPTPLTEDEIANISALHEMLDVSDDNDRIMKAEAIRELAKYEEAMALLSVPFPDQLSQAAGIIKGLAAQGISSVREMEFK